MALAQRKEQEDHAAHSCEDEDQANDNVALPALFEELRFQARNLVGEGDGLRNRQLSFLSDRSAHVTDHFLSPALNQGQGIALAIRSAHTLNLGHFAPPTTARAGARECQSILLVVLLGEEIAPRGGTLPHCLDVGGALVLERS